MSATGAGFATLAIHAGALAIPPARSPFTQSDQTAGCLWHEPGLAASLLGLQTFGSTSAHLDPTSAVLEERIATLEGGTAAVAVASGRAARMLAFHALLQPGDELVAARRSHGNAIDQLEHGFESFGWIVRWADMDAPESFVEALSDRTKAIFIESMAEPGGAVSDIEAIAAIARRARVPLVVDNSLATPYLVRPFEHGADIVLHPAIKFLSGLGNVRGGLIVEGGSFSFAGDGRYPLLSRPSPFHDGLVIAEAFGNFAFAVGARMLGLRNIGTTISPLDALLILNGIETLPLRMQRHCDNALAVAQHLSGHAKVAFVNYAGLERDPGHTLTQRYCPRGAGAALTFDVGSCEAGVALVGRLRLFARIAEGGGARSMVSHRAGDAGLVRLSIGLEDVTDITADLDQALAG